MNGMKRDAAVLEPVGNFAHMLFAIGVVEVLSRGKISMACAPPAPGRQAAQDAAALSHKRKWISP